MSSNIIKLRVGGRYKADELRKLSAQLKRGILTRLEFERRKRELLGRSRISASAEPGEDEMGPEEEIDVGESLIAEALAMLADPDETAHACTANVVSFDRWN